MKKLLVFFFTIGLLTLSVQGQEIEKTWQFSSIENADNLPLYSISEQDTLLLKGGEFFLALQAKNNLDRKSVV